MLVPLRASGRDKNLAQSVRAILPPMPRRSKKPLVIVSRESPLARWQAQWVAERIRKQGKAVEHLWLTSSGDRFEGRLNEAAGKGMFTSEIEAALLDGRADIAVHSMKDVPACPSEQTPGLTIAAVPPRATANDVLISRHGTSLEDLPEGAWVGTASQRRQAQLARLRPDLRFTLLRGNVDTRLNKAKVLPLDAGGVDATLLAEAGLTRLGHALSEDQRLSASQVLPAPAQGALALQCKGTHSNAMLALLPLNDTVSAMAVQAERQVAVALGATCHSAMGCLVARDGHSWHLHARVLSPDGQQMAEVDRQEWGVERLHDLVRAAVEDLKAQGAAELIRQAH